MMSIKRHTESMGCEFMSERDLFAFTVNNLSATLGMKKLATEMERRFGTKGRMDAWTRMDMHSKTYKTTSKGGPAWSCIQGDCRRKEWRHHQH